MTEDEQEALSFRYVMPRVVRLSSGRFALFVDYQNLQILTADELAEALPSTKTIAEANEALDAVRRSISKPNKINSLNLADLGL